ncbi:WD40-repeat-containing domain protein [Phyllosticta citrichinensis]|uniref:WD40-repeat-containing domain protein n=1 Tax=Phyllosticta citrichinensis TaxID=1130410 RepID=A0ABR1Y0P5_9PEZI
MRRGSFPSGSHVRERIASRCLDRFIPPRKSPTTSRETLRLSTPAENLSEVEKFTRQRHPEFDPFGQHVPRSTRNQSYQNLQGAVRPTGIGPSSPSPEGILAPRHGSREVSNGAVWNVGGSAIVTDSVPGIPDGRGGMLSSGTNAPLHTTMFLTQVDSESAQEEHERRLAHAMDIDTSSRVLGSFDKPGNPPGEKTSRAPSWINSQWIREGCTTILDAPRLRDDFYCTVLAYSRTANCLAVGLAHSVYLWSETRGVGTPESINASYTAHVTSLSFSSSDGGQAILAIGRADGSVCLWSLFDEEPRFKARQPAPISCLSFSPNTFKLSSIRDPALVASTETLLVGDEEGHVYLFSVEWPDVTSRDLFNWPGAMTLLARINVHSQQICGLAWSPCGEFFASGGNDNQCFLFETKRLFASLNNLCATMKDRSQVTDIDATAAKHCWTLNAAVKAMAFCPWQRGLLAIGGGSNDRCIHFYHTFSGACLATIDCSAQVTSLIWSTTRREICATFGFAQPDHPFRVAVFSWPACEQLVAIPWPDDHRALFAIAYPGGPNDGRTRGEGGAWWSRTQVEGCIVVATSDTSIKFHEVWSEERRKAKPLGALGGSEILEELHGADRHGLDTIR